MFERGFVTYSNAAKIGDLGVDYELLSRHGAVSAEVAAAMAAGALALLRRRYRPVAVTGVAGPGGGTAEKPVGLVHYGTRRPHLDAPVLRVFRFGDIGRTQIRQATVAEALRLIEEEVASR